MKKAALISVSDRTGLIEFARDLQSLDYVILGTKGTKIFLEENGIKVHSIEEYTGQKEILGGRVKTLHPRIHAGILARRSVNSDLSELEANDIFEINVVAVNLYPFQKALESSTARSYQEMIELIDVGGPTMIRAAAKNAESVYAVIDPSDYSRVATELNNNNNLKSESAILLRRQLAVKVFNEVSNYDASISHFLNNSLNVSSNATSPIKDKLNIDLQISQILRYGENPHQQAAFYKKTSDQQSYWEQLQGKELSYNNFLDFDAGYRIIKSLSNAKPAVAIIKHLNPCGVAYGKNLKEALEFAKRGDPRSHFGGIIACNKSVDLELAQSIVEDFAEIVVAPDFTSEALNLLANKKNLRLIKVLKDFNTEYEIRNVADGILIQVQDNSFDNLNNAEVVSDCKPTDKQLEDLDLAWRVCAHVKSNAIVIVKNNMLLASGAGQMSRVDSVEIAINKSKVHNHDLQGAVVASDAFFPFPDSIELLAEEGIKAIIAPSGAKKDNEIISTCNSHGITLLFAKERHFRH
jgi:phosphoribosylaminoimidazolecarboxamide formyltransferase/IMP cyclohydrolase